MKRGITWLLGLLGVLLLAFGLGCLNYTKADGLEHHREVAARYNLPPPSETILYGGVLSVIVGSGTVGFALGGVFARRSSRNGKASR
jgi:hypothetical protein